MSVTSHDPNTANANFSDWLSRYPVLVGWLTACLEREPELSEEEVHSRFLAECLDQGVSSEAYPFTEQDRGLFALRDFRLRLQAGTGPGTIPLHIEDPQPEKPTSVVEQIPLPPGIATSEEPASVAEQVPVSSEIAVPMEFAAVSASVGAQTPGALSISQAELPEALDDTDSIPTSAPAAEKQIADPAMATEAGATAHTSTDTPVDMSPSLDTEGGNDASTHEDAPPTPGADKADVSPAPKPAPSRLRLLFRPRTRRQRVTSLLLLAIVLLAVLTPTGVAIGYGASAYATYNELRSQAHDAVDHLLNIKTIFNGVSAHPSGFLDVTKLQRARKELVAAGQDFQQLSVKIDHTPIISTITTYFPQYRVQVNTARAACKIGLDVVAMGENLIDTALILAPSFRGPLLTSSTQPLVTQNMLDLVGSTIDFALPRLNDIQTQSRFLSISALPISGQQRDQFTQVVEAIPQIATDLGQVRDLLGTAGWMLGVDSPRTFLVQTMDRAELRPTGGFTGQYGELKINGGRVAPFSLRDISLLEYTDNSPTQGQQAPAQYRSWWPFANWGLRDSNVSADFPTSAQIAINLYQRETKHHVDGVIIFTPFLIEHVLQVIGPITVPGYNDTITAQNLEDRLHYYQQDNAGIAKQVVYQPGNTTTSERKRFTSYLASLLLDRVRHAPPDEILAIGREMLHDLKTKDLQLYFTNPDAEGVLMRYGDAAQVDRSLTHDGLYVVQANLSASKASQYVKTILHDTVTLDSNGGATHTLQMRLVYNQLGPVYGYDTYHDYVRVYVPPNSKFLWGNGFDTGQPLCGGTYGDCPPNGVYPGGELTCPTGQYQPGAEAPTFTDESGADWHPLDTIGPPTSLTSDESGRAMFGGWVIVPKNCTMTVSLSWYVPPMPQNPYTLLVQRQAGTFPELDLTILPSPGNCSALRTTGLHFDAVLGEDASFTTQTFSAKNQSKDCYPQQGV